MSVRGKPFFIPPTHYGLLLLFLILGILVLMPMFMLGMFTTLLRSVGLDFYSGFTISLTILVFSVVLSPINLPVFKVEKNVYVPTVEFVVVFGIPYPVPRLSLSTRRIVIALNLGGALIPLMISLYLASRLVVLGFDLAHALLGVLIVALFTFSVSKTVPGIGIVTPAFLPPLASALTSILITGGSFYSIPLSYISGTLGTLIGGDVLRLWRDWDRLNAPIVSIGGAGTFDGIYLTGIFSVALVLFFM